MRRNEVFCFRWANLINLGRGLDGLYLESIIRSWESGWEGVLAV